MQTAYEYKSDIRTAPFGERTITVENLTPVLTQKERDKRKREIEQRLFNVFSKYRTQTASSRF